MSDNWGSGGGDSWGNDAAAAVAEASPDAFEFDAGQADVDRVGGRATIDKIGKYHFEIIDVKPELETVTDKGQPKSPSVNYTLRVVESAPGQSPSGSLAWKRIYVGESGGGPPKQGSYDSMVDFLVSIGRLRRVVVDGVTRFINPLTGTSKFALDLLLKAKGDQFLGNIRKSEKQTKRNDENGNPQWVGTGEFSYELPMSGGTFRLDDPAVADVPKNRDAAALWTPLTNDRGEVHFPDGSEKPKRGGGRKKADEPAATPAAAVAPVAAATPATPATQPKPAAPAPAAVVVDADF